MDQLTKLCPERKQGKLCFGKPAPWNNHHIMAAPESGIGAAASKNLHRSNQRCVACR
jgi:hypothetical protein